MKHLLTAVLGLLLSGSGCSPRVPPASLEGRDEAGEHVLQSRCVYDADAPSGCRFYAVSLIDLISRPELYDNKRVFVAGFVSIEFEGDAIYLSREDWAQSVTKNGLWLDAPMSDDERATWPDREYAIIEGTFNARQHGHMDLWSGAIEQIGRIEPSLRHPGAVSER